MDEASAELFSAARLAPSAGERQSRPHKAPQERRSPDSDWWRNTKTFRTSRFSVTMRR